MINIGKLSIVCLAVIVIFGGGCSKQEKSKSIAPANSGTISLAECKNSTNPFACIVDRSMQANDPSLCASAGEEKRMNCVKAYVEITGAPIECIVLSDPKFRAECEQSFSSLTTVPSTANTTNRPTTSTFDTNGLRIDQP